MKVWKLMYNGVELQARVLKEKKVVEAHVKEQKRQQQRKVCDVIEPPRKHHHRQHQQNYYMSYDANKDTNNNNASVIPPRPRYHVRNPKPVDEDLYKIPPELLRNSKRVSLLLLHFCFSFHLMAALIF